jgi:hypothetical protein
MDADGLTKVKVAVRKISFLMPHQRVLSDLKELAAELCPHGADHSNVNRESPEYLLGAYEALNFLISDLEGKGD